MLEVSAKIGLASEKEADPWPRAESERIPSQRHSSEDTFVVLTRPSVLMQSGDPIDEKAEEKTEDIWLGSIMVKLTQYGSVF